MSQSWLCFLIFFFPDVQAGFIYLFIYLFYFRYTRANK